MDRWTVKHYSNKILQFLTPEAANTGEPVYLPNSGRMSVKLLLKSHDLDMTIVLK